MQRNSNNFKLVKCIACPKEKKKLYYRSREAVSSLKALTVR